ncbi:MAG: hypothetical protein ACXWAC_12715 [Usitatibacter sp.]
MASISRPVITGPNMYSLLIREFERLRPEECKRCRIPLPFWGPAAGNSEGYWYMGVPDACPFNCRQVIAKLWAKMTTEYVISPPQRRAVAVAKFVEHPEWAPE